MADTSYQVYTCKRPGCHGSIEDGFCDTCGKADIRDKQGVVLSQGVVSSDKAIDFINKAPSTYEFIDNLMEVELPESKRSCPHCGVKVIHMTGTCSICLEPYDLRPFLGKNEVIKDRYRVDGLLAYGGMGWIYLATDLVLGREVVLKSALNAINNVLQHQGIEHEKNMLAAVEHRSIVDIYDYIEFKGVLIIVMEYARGSTAEKIRSLYDKVSYYDKNLVQYTLFRSEIPADKLAQSEIVSRGVLPLLSALKYIKAILPAFEYLHSKQLVYCDFKPENVIIESDNSVRLIDMGSVKRIGVAQKEVSGTPGIMHETEIYFPDAQFDIYTIGRVLALLTFNFDFNSKYKQSIPDPFKHISENDADYKDQFYVNGSKEFLLKHPSYYYFLNKATALDKNDRFKTIQEMAACLELVYQQVISTESGIKKALISSNFDYDNAFSWEDGINVANANYWPYLKLAIDSPVVWDIVCQVESHRNLDELVRTTLSDNKSHTHLWAVFQRCLQGRRYDHAIKVCKALVQFESDAFKEKHKKWFQAVYSLLTKSFQQAASLFSELALADFVGDSACYTMAGISLELAQDQEGALFNYETAFNADANAVIAAIGLVRIYAAKYEYEKAINCLSNIKLRTTIASQIKTSQFNLFLAQIKQDSTVVDNQIILQFADLISTCDDPGIAIYYEGLFYEALYEACLKNKLVLANAFKRPRLDAKSGDDYIIFSAGAKNSKDNNRKSIVNILKEIYSKGLAEAGTIKDKTYYELKYNQWKSRNGIVARIIDPFM